MPQPIDMQSEINRVAMAERMQDAATRSSLAAQHRAQMDVEEDERIHETQVNETEETSQSEIDKDARGKNALLKKRKKKKKKTPADDASHTMYTSHEQKEVVPDPDDHNLDVTI